MTEAQSSSRIEETLKALPKPVFATAKAKHYAEYAGLVGLSFLFRCLPERAALAFARGLALAVKPLLGRRNRRSLELIREVMKLEGKEAEEFLNQSYRNFAENWVLMTRLEKPSMQDRLGMDGIEHLEKAEKEGRGIVLACCHFYHWEIAPYIFHKVGKDSAFLATIHHNPFSDRWMFARREHGCNRVIHNKLGVRHSLRVLKKGGRLIILCDVDGGPDGIPADFMGKPSMTPQGPIRMALQTGSLLAVGAMVRHPDGSERMTITEPIDPKEMDGDGDKKLKNLATWMNGRMAELISIDPPRWFWMQNRWKTEVPAEQ